MKDIFDKCKGDEGYFGKFRSTDDHFFCRPTLNGLPSTRMEYDGQEKIMWSINNYLGLAGNEEIQRVARDAIDTYSVSSPMGSRMMSGTTDEHYALEKSLAEFAQKETAHLFNFGYLGVLGTVQALIGPQDVIIMDKLSHACIIDAVLLSKAKFRIFRHNDMEDLEKVLKETKKDCSGGILIITEGTFGMTGDLAKLDTMCDLKEKYGARIFIDDAHGAGVMGKEGRGAAEHFGVQDRVDIYFSTFAKAFASIGGFAAAEKDVIEWIRFNARTQVFAKSLPMVYVKSLQKTLQIIIENPALRNKLWKNSNRLKESLQGLGFHVGGGESPICAIFAPVPDGDNKELHGMAMIKFLRDRGVFVTGVIYPVIPVGLFEFRMIPTAAHTDKDIDDTVKVFKEMQNEIGFDTSLTENDLRKIKQIYPLSS